MANPSLRPCDAGVIQAAPDTWPCNPGLGRWVLIATILGSGIEFIDGTVVNVALPVLQRDLGAGVTDMQWIAGAYDLPLAALMLVGGALGDHFGRRRIFAAGIVLFLLGSVTCGLSAGVGQMIAGRAIQGIGGALLVPGSLAMISATFSKQQRGRAIGTWAGFTSLAAAVGPLVGGLLIEHLSWRWVFFVNLPLALGVLWVLFRRVPESRSAATGRLDLLGASLSAASLLLIVSGLIRSVSLGPTSPAILGTVVLGVGLLCVFFLVEARRPEPMLPLGLFRSRAFAGANLMTLLLYGGLGGVLFFLPFDLIQVQGYSATAAGAALLPPVLIIFFLSRWSGGLAARFGARRMLVVGPVLVALGLALLARPAIGGSYFATFFPAMVLLGLGMVASVAPLTVTVMESADERQAGLASGINNVASQLAGLLAMALLGIVVVTAFNHGLDRRLLLLDLPSEARAQLDAQRIRLAAAEVPGSLSEPVRTALRTAIALSFVDGFRLGVLLAALAVLGSALTAYVMLAPSSEAKRRGTAD